jgi:hypothetical protein
MTRKEKGKETGDCYAIKDKILFDPFKGFMSKI